MPTTKLPDAAPLAGATAPDPTDDEPATPAAGGRLSRLARVWIVGLVVQAALWYFLYRGAYLRPLWSAPAAVVLVLTVLASVRALRPRPRGRDRRAGDRREGGR